MKGLDVAFCQHQINLNLSYGVKVKEEINKLLRVGFIRPVKKDATSNKFTQRCKAGGRDALQIRQIT